MKVNTNTADLRRIIFLNRVNVLIDSGDFHAEFREQAETALSVETGAGWAAIAATDIINRISVMPLSYIRAWRRGENGLHWVDQQTGYDYRREMAAYNATLKAAVNG